MEKGEQPVNGGNRRAGVKTCRDSDGGQEVVGLRPSPDSSRGANRDCTYWLDEACDAGTSADFSVATLSPISELSSFI